MPHVTFIYPAIGSFGTKYVRTWQMQPLAIAALSSLTQAHWQRSFFDDRLESIEYDKPTGLAAISVEAFTARRAYQIAAEYRKRHVPVVMGGYHATFCPDEVLEHADAVCVGEAENVWADMLYDTEHGKLLGKYSAPSPSEAFTGFDRSVFQGKNYFDIALVETGRGCKFNCSFCSIAAFNKSRYKPRPVEAVIEEVRALKESVVFFVDDNIVGDFQRARTFFAALKGMRKKWVGQASINITQDDALLKLMRESGCAGLLIGFESLSTDGLRCVNKKVNCAVDYVAGMRKIRKNGMVVYGTFLLGLPTDSQSDVKKIIDFAIEQKLFLAGFNNVIPFPGTPLYGELQKKRVLRYEKWWLSPEYRFGESPFNPEKLSADELLELGHYARRKFYGLNSIFRRSWDFSANCGGMHIGLLYFISNIRLRIDLSRKIKMRLGF